MSAVAKKTPKPKPAPRPEATWNVVTADGEPVESNVDDMVTAWAKLLLSIVEKKRENARTAGA